ncbi:unnamed protein product [Brassicogethes aeneus]|uniref:Regulatory protein zeste n=1 Tax=Brassicogethes aeneus TaxID=1431903 RepID=A0A9P0FDC1_BRAAE|nr:unnamed protein product [Brassicogethes aeneus]
MLSRRNIGVYVRSTKYCSVERSKATLPVIPQNKTILTIKPHPLKVGELLKLWESIGKSLNLLSGPKKCAEDWRRYFVEWKSRTRKKARDFKVEAQATGGGPNSAKPLTELEEKLMGLLGWVSAQGYQDIPEEQEIQEKPKENENSNFSRVLQINES